MDRHIHLVVALIYDSDNLLEGFTYWHTDKSGKLTDSVVNMNDKVTRLHLLKFLHSKCHLTGTSRLSTEIVLMETLKNLVIGEETEAEVVIHESLMKSL